MLNRKRFAKKIILNQKIGALFLLLLGISMVSPQALSETGMPPQQVDGAQGNSSAAGSPAPEQNQTPETALTDVQKVLKEGWMTLCPDGKFHSERYLTRAELATILTKVFPLAKQKSVHPGVTDFVDVPKTHWAYSAVETVARLDIMQGYREGRFYPNQMMSRGEAIACFSQAYGVFQFKPNTLAQIYEPYPDADKVPDWAKKAVATAISEGFVNTDAHHHLNPMNPMTRGDMAYMLGRLYDRRYHRG